MYSSQLLQTIDLRPYKIVTLYPEEILRPPPGYSTEGAPSLLVQGPLCIRLPLSRFDLLCSGSLTFAQERVNLEEIIQRVIDFYHQQATPDYLERAEEIDDLDYSFFLDLLARGEFVPRYVTMGQLYFLDGFVSIPEEDRESTPRGTLFYEISFSAQ